MVFSTSSSFSSIIYSRKNDGHNVLVRISPSERFVLSVATHITLVVVINRERAHIISSKFSIVVAPFTPSCTCVRLCVCLYGGKMDISSERFVSMHGADCYSLIHRSHDSISIVRDFHVNGHLCQRNSHLVPR